MAQELVSATGLAGGPAGVFAGQGMDESLSDGIGGGYPLIRYRGKVWSIQVRGETYGFTDEKGYPVPYLDLIILRQAQNKSKAYFEHYEDGSKDAPICTSSDGVVPDLGVLHKQSETCGMCPRNVFKPNEKGVKVKECSDAKRLAVLPLPAQTQKAIGESLVEPVFLRVPAASLQNLAQMGDAARKMGYPYFAFVTRVDFDPDKSFPKMRFTALQKLDDAVGAKIMELREDPMSYRIIGGDTTGQTAMKQVAQMAEPAGTLGIVQQTAPIVAGTAQWMVQQTAPIVAGTAQSDLAAKLEADRVARFAAVKAESAANEAANAAAAKPAVEAPRPAPGPITLELKANPPTTGPAPAATGLEGITTTAPPQQAAPAQTTVSDTGEPEQADEALDAAINALLPT